MLKLREQARESARPENCSLFSPDHRGWGDIRCRPVFERFDTGSAAPDESLNSSSLSRHCKHSEHDQGFPVLLPVCPGSFLVALPTRDAHRAPCATGNEFVS